MLKICLLWLQIIEYFYQIYPLGCICMYIKNILETKSLTFMAKFSFQDQRKFSLFLFINTNCYVDQCEPQVSLIMSQMYFLFES